MQIRIGDIFRAPGSVVDDDKRFPELELVSRGRHGTGVNHYQGMFFFRTVVDPSRVERRPAFVFLSNNLRPVSESNPWLDVIEADAGYALYHGDNRTPGRSALEGRGNNAFNAIIGQYGDPTQRQLAAPILVFEHAAVEGRKKGYRRFAGFGVPTGVRLQTQATRSERFTNLAIDLALFGLEAEGDLFDWGWIDDRRDQSMVAAQSNQSAPESWKSWVAEGTAAIERIRRNVVREKSLPSLRASRGLCGPSRATHSHPSVLRIESARIRGPSLVRHAKGCRTRLQAGLGDSPIGRRRNRLRQSARCWIRDGLNKRSDPRPSEEPRTVQNRGRTRLGTSCRPTEARVDRSVRHDRRVHGSRSTRVDRRRVPSAVDRWHASR